LQLRYPKFIHGEGKTHRLIRIADKAYELLQEVGFMDDPDLSRNASSSRAIPVERMILYTFLINAGLVTLASLLVSPIYLAKFSNGETLGLAAFIAAARLAIANGAINDGSKDQDT